MRALIRYAALGTAVALMSIGAVANATHQAPQTIDPDGGADDTVVGLADNGTATAVWSSRGELRYAVRALNGRFGVPVPFGGAGLVGEVAFAESSIGHAIVAWTDLSADGDVRASVRIGNAFTPGVIVSGPMGANNPTGVRVAINDAGRAVVVWHQFGADPGSINAALFDDGSFDPAVALVTDSAVLQPTVGIDGTGRALAVWDYDTQNDDEIQGAAAPAGGAFGAPFMIEQMQQGSGTPDLAVNESGDAVLAYEDGIPSSECTGGQSCSLFRVETRYGSVDGTFGAQQPTPLNNESGYGPGDHEVAIDDSGKAAVLMSISSPAGRVLARTSDAAGTFGPLQTVSAADSTTGPGLGTTNMDIDAGGGEFTAAFANDHVGDGDENEVYQASTTNGTFGEVHQLSPTDDDPPAHVTVGRNASGQTVTGWDIFINDLVPQATPVGTQAALTEGTSGADNLTGTSGADVVFLNAGNDRFNGAGGKDEILGGAGRDVLNGGGGNDEINGGGGDDKLIGGAGTDVMNGGPGKDTCSGTAKERPKAISCEKWLPITV